jgi:single-strand DNA-binding protein
MMADLNQCQFIGRLGADPEVKSFANGGRIANLRIAVGEKWKDKATGEQKERTEWISVTLQTEGLVGVAERYLKKGSRVFVQGQFRTRKWQDQSGQDRYATEIVVGGFGGILTMLDGKQDSGRAASNEGTTTTHYGAHGGTSTRDDLDDDIPF